LVHLELPYNRAVCLIFDRIFMKKYMCLICGWIYDEAEGCADDGIAPGTRWDDVPMNWTCPECGARKDDFEMVEI
jgi:rubredoxin